MGIRKELLEEETGFEQDREGIMVVKIRRGTERWRMVGVYAKKEGLEGILKDLERWTEEREEGIKTIIGGDFNARTEREGVGVEEKGDRDREGREGRRSKDGKLDKEGRILVKFIEERGWEIFNGNIRGDEEGDCMYTGALGSTVVDYVLEDKEVKKSVKEMRIGDNIDSDDHTMEVIIKGKDKWRGIKREESRVWRGVWDVEGREEFRKRVGGMEMEGDKIKEEWKEMESKIKEA